MIERLTIKGFKSFAKVDLNLGPLNVFIGANSSGKSNLFDALRIVQGIGYGLRIDEIFNGKPKSGNSEVWEGIRGGGKYAARVGPGSDGLVGIGVGGTVSPVGHFDYDILLRPAAGTVVSEQTTDSPGPHQVDAVLEYLDVQPRLESDLTRPPIAQLAADNPDRGVFVKALLALFSDSQRLDPSPAILRAYSSPGEVKRMGERGENFAALVKQILAEPGTAAAFRSWLMRLTPRDLDDVTTLSGALGEPLFALKFGGNVFPAPILSDGTLRFAALTAAFFQPDMPKTLVLEEIENGLHPSRLRLLVELLQERSSVNGPQVFASTHSPVVLDWLRDTGWQHCFLCRHDEETGVSTVQPLSSLPRFMEIAARQPVGELFTEGWMETLA